MDLPGDMQVDLRQAFPQVREEDDTLEGWGLYLRPDTLSRVLPLLESRIQLRWPEAEWDFLCGIYTCGVPLAAMLSLRMHKPLIEYHSWDVYITTGMILRARDLLTTEKRCLLVDTVINTGSSAGLALDLLTKAGISVVGLATVVNNDLIPGHLSSQFKQGRPGIPIESLVTASDLYTHA